MHVYFSSHATFKVHVDSSDADCNDGAAARVEPLRARRVAARDHPLGPRRDGGGRSSGWLIRFFDSSFFCEWIAVSYLYKHDHAGVRDYLCNRMYTLPSPASRATSSRSATCLSTSPAPPSTGEVPDRRHADGRVAPARLPPTAPASAPASPRNNPVLNRIRSSKQKLLSLASSPALGSGSPIEESSRGNDSGGKALSSSEENKLFKKLIPGPKVRDALFFRKSLEREEEESDKEGFFKRLLRDSKEEEDSEKDGFFRRLLRDSKDEEGELTASSEGFLKRLFRDKEDRLGDEDEKEGFSAGFLRIRMRRRRIVGMISMGGASGEAEHEEKENRTAEEDEKEKEGFFQRLFRDKNEEKKESAHDRKEEEEKSNKSTDDDNFFRRLFKDKNEEKRLAGHEKNDDEKCNGSIEEVEKENFFRRLFKDKHEEKRNEGHDKNDEYNKSGSFDEEETSEFLSFRRLFRVHPEDVKSSGVNENGYPSSPFESSPGTENFFRRLFRDRDRSVEDSELFGSKILKEKRPGSPRQRNEKQSGKPPLPNNVISEIRKGSYHASLEFVQSLCDTSYGLVDIFPIEDRKIALRESLTEINSHLAAAQNNGGICFPMGKGMYRVIHIPEDEAVLLNSREKAPFLICVEVLKVEATSTKASSDAQKLSRGGIPLANGDAQLPKPPPWAYPLWSRHDIHNYDTDRMLKSTSQAIDQAMAQLWEAKVKFVHVSFSIEKHFVGRSRNSVEASSGNKIQQATVSAQDSASESRSHNDHRIEWVRVNLSAVPGVNMEDVDDPEPTRRKDHRRVPSTIAIEEVKAAAAKGQAPPGLPLKGAGQDSQDVAQKVTNGHTPKPTDALSGELWELKKERIRRSSAHGKLPGWDLRSVIVKSGDDCRQEHLAVQLVSHFYDIYQEAGLPLWLRPYEVLVTSSYTALIETIPDTASIHSIKSRFPNISSLRDYFLAKYGDNSPNFKLAQRNFVESMAGYSILCYLLQVKDRHNGNLLMDEEGHIIHIDFGFMLSNSPGGVNFESAPFKLTRELLEVMDSDAEGTPSEFFDYFKVLCIQGFLTCRKHAERIILLVEMLQDSGFPCFKGGPRTIQNLRKRFHLSLTEEQCVSLVLSLISSSLDAWRTRQYDYYQRVLNGIL
uniref:1-phosphatidylinositol 4-kinase n=1 Tax=Ananas comosus var. bracteatus TaxID=296719 RepID=A0A6V7QG14_ANACO|nr:unnamed protein product [Ananas comosus var. bracteatus]